MPTPTIQTYEPGKGDNIEKRFKGLLDAYIENTQQLQWLLSNLDTKNITSLQVDKLIAGSAKISSALIESLTVGGNVAQGSAARVFSTTPTPPYSVGDVWSAGALGDLKICTTAKATGQAYAAEDWVLATKYTDDSALTTFVSAVYNPEIIDLQSQIDGNITSWFYTYVPSLINVPASDWTTDALKNQHLGDLFYNTTSGYAYRFALITGTYQWIQLSDSDIALALANAAAAQDTADNKRRVFITIPTPPYDVGDLWAGGSAGDLKRCGTAKTAEQSYAAEDWVLATKYTDDTTANTAIEDAATAQSAAETAQTTADAKIETYYQAAAPHTEYTNEPDNATYNKLVGDMWYDSDSAAKNTYRYSKTANGGNFDYKWLELEIPASVFDKIDGKRTVFMSEPTVPYYVGDLWLTSLTESVGDLKKCITERTTGIYTASEWVVATKYTDDTTANTAIGLLEDIADDAKVTSVEKLTAKQHWDNIVAEGDATTGTLVVAANALSVAHTTFDTKYAALNTYLNTTLTVFADMTATTTVVRATWDTAWKDYFAARTALLNDIDAAAIRVGKYYNQVKITEADGIQVFDESTPTPIERVKIGDLGGGKYGMYLKDKDDNITFETDSDGNAILKSRVELPSAGMTNDGATAADIRMWAGDTYANRTTAPFRVSQDGSLYASKVTLIGSSGYKAGQSTFTDNDTSQTFTDAECTADSLVMVAVTGATPPNGHWIATAEAGQFTITSTIAETDDITFDYYILKWGSLSGYRHSNAVFTDNDTAQTFTDTYCTADSLVVITITSGTAAGTWTVESAAGSFTITSSATESDDISFDYYIIKEVE